MKQAIFFLIISIGISSSSCKKNNSSSSYSPDCTGTTPTYKTEVSPLFSTYCATSGCHTSGSSQGPGALTTYAEIKNASFSIRTSIVSGRMPQGTTLTTTQKNTIVCWIDAGVINN
ncbi:hypothetical protein [Aurantibacillus circumpalustris]|uniref:hypothetical protein n=1 Tax=Aurantibacillus circumpalustris TaxID=3036359 RepID=UPI00295BD9CD|nr:hypothetical protein [Aurantibacillus circumpalustris]